MAEQRGEPRGRGHPECKWAACNLDWIKPRRGGFGFYRYGRTVHCTRKWQRRHWYIRPRHDLGHSRLYVRNFAHKCRSEERRVGKEGGSKWKSRWSADQ